MTAALWIALGLALTAPQVGPGPERVEAVDLAAYARAKAKTGPGASAQLDLALWCEAHGLTAERVKHLALAVLTDPANARARGLMGLVAFGGKWADPDDVSRAVNGDPNRAAVVREYLDKRAATPDRADPQWALALWCEGHGLKAESVAHLHAVTRLDPGREAAWKRLGYHKQKGRWVDDRRIAAEKAEADAQRKANQHWKPRLEALRAMLSDRSPKQRSQAEAALGAVDDPRAAPSVWAVFVASRNANQALGGRVLGQLDGPAASQALAVLAVFGRDPEARRAAAETLLRRDAREFSDLLVGMLREPTLYVTKPVGGPGSPGELVVKNKAMNVKRLYTPPAVPIPPMHPGDTLSYDEQGLPVVSRSLGATWTGPMPALPQPTPGQGIIDGGKAAQFLEGRGLNPAVSRAIGQAAQNSSRPTPAPVGNIRPGERVRYLVPQNEVIPVGRMMLEAQQAAATASKQLADDVAVIDQSNSQVRENNDRVKTVLTPLVGKDLGDDVNAWRAWTTDLKGYAFVPLMTPDQSPPTVVQQVPIDFQAQASPVIVTGAPISAERVRHSCFGAGTLVKTLNGPRPIETIQAGDQVLTQDTTTGALAYQAVLRAFHNPPNNTLAVNLGDEPVVVTGIHRFWKAGSGWVMARELKPGDRVRTVGGSAKVESVSDGEVQPVYNLEVASGSSFFVGKAGALVHDNSLVNPVAKPFDAAPDLASAKVAGRAGLDAD